MILVGNKCDLKARREVTAQEGQSEAVKRNCAFVETTGRDKESVNNMFMELLTRIFPVKNQHNGKQTKKKKSLKMKLSGSKTTLANGNKDTETTQTDPTKDVNEKIIKESIEKEEKEAPNEEKKEKKAPRGRQCSIL